MKHMLSCFVVLQMAAIAGAQTVTLEDSLDQYFRETKSVTEQYRSLWNYDLYAPILLVNRNNRMVYANTPDSANFLAANGKVYTGTLPNNVNIANTSVQWAGRHWAMIMLPLPKEKSDRINLITHELFHRAQPYLNLNPRNYDNNHLDKKEGRIYLRLELEALRQAMKSDGTKDIDKHLRSALIFRKARYSLYPGADTLENLLELNEGLCEFTGVMMSGRDKDELRAHFSGHIDAFLGNRTFIRSFPYETIPIYGYLLSDRKPGWNREVNRQTNLTNLFIKSFNIQMDTDVKSQANKIQDAYNGKTIVSEEDKREMEILALQQEYRHKFIESPHFELLFENMNISFDYTNIMPLDDKGVVYPTIRVKDNWGILEVKNGGLMNPDWKKITVSKPIDIGNQTIKGDGWVLELKEGYTIKEDAQTKNFYLTKTR